MAESDNIPNVTINGKPMSEADAKQMVQEYVVWFWDFPGKACAMQSIMLSKQLKMLVSVVFHGKIDAWAAELN